MIEKAEQALRTIGEAAETLGVETHVLRYWETQFSQIKPVKRKNGRRYYRPEDMAMLAQIQQLLHQRGFTIKGAQGHLRLLEKEKLAASAILPVPAATVSPALFVLHEEKQALPAQSEKNTLQEGLTALHKDLLQLREKAKAALS